MKEGTMCQKEWGLLPPQHHSVWFQRWLQIKSSSWQVLFLEGAVANFADCAFAFWMHCSKVLVFFFFIRCVLNCTSNLFKVLLPALWKTCSSVLNFTHNLRSYTKSHTSVCTGAALLWCTLLSQQYHVSLNEFKVEKNQIIPMLWRWDEYVLPEQVLFLHDVTHS